MRYPLTWTVMVGVFGPISDLLNGKSMPLGRHDGDVPDCLRSTQKTHSGLGWTP